MLSKLLHRNYINITKKNRKLARHSVKWHLIFFLFQLSMLKHMLRQYNRLIHYLVTINEMCERTKKKENAFTFNFMMFFIIRLWILTVVINWLLVKCFDNTIFWKEEKNDERSYEWVMIKYQWIWIIRHSCSILIFFFLFFAERQ